MNADPRILLVVGLTALAACGDARGPVDTAAVLVPGAVVRATLLCNATVSSGAVSCREKTLPGAGSRVVIGGPNGGLIQLTSSNVSATPDTFAFDVTVLHRIVQALGTTDGTTAHSSGVRVFFSTPPYTTSRVDENALDFIDVANEDGSAVFEGSTSRPYFQYAGLLANNTTSASKRWKLELVNVNTFAFEVKVWGEVRYPNGWTTITPANVSLSAGGADEQLRTIVRDVYGQSSGTDSMAWTSSNSGVVAVTPTAKQYADVVGVTPGTAWVRAVSTTSPTIQRDSILITVY